MLLPGQLPTDNQTFARLASGGPDAEPDYTFVNRSVQIRAFVPNPATHIMLLTALLGVILLRPRKQR